MPVTWSPTDKSAGWTLSNGNLTATAASPIYGHVRGSQFVNTAAETRKFYYELTIDSLDDGFFGVGIGLNTAITSGNAMVGRVSGTAGYQPSNTASEFMVNNGGGVNSDLTAVVATDVIGVGFDPVTRLVTFYKNGVASTLQLTTPQNAGLCAPMLTDYATGAYTANFGATAFVALPSGYVGWEVLVIPHGGPVRCVSSPRPIHFIGL